ncbi:MAG TPA: hypothetical protein VMV40_01355 [Acidiferrobacter sp.]|nr:hypothetical protein [Acidiferrobacter sp.]
MFKGLLSFGMVRTPLQAFGFYVAYLLVGVLIGALAGGLSAVAGGTPGVSNFALGLRYGAVAGTIYVAAIGITVVAKKNLGFGYYLLALLGAIMALFGGALLGLIPVAFMTTRQAQKVLPAE